MKVMKVRRLGNSNVVTLPHELEAAGYVAGATVLVEHLDDGTLHIIPTGQVRERIRMVGRRVIVENREPLALLAAHDRDAGEDRG